ncbi:collectin-10-like [Branchiostoma floridae x Branchiostoma japonicum]
MKRDLDNEQNRTAALEQRLHEMSKTPGYAVFRGICYKAFDKQKTFSGAAAACREDGGTLAMPRDAETNAFLFSLYKSVSNILPCWIGLHDQGEEGSFEWVDGSALGTYNNWAPGQPDNRGGNQDCVYYFVFWGNKWADSPCDFPAHFICQAVPGTSYKRTIS